MRRASAVSGPLKFIYPDEVCFAYNPNYLVIESPTFSNFNIKVFLNLGDNPCRMKEISVVCHGDTVKVYLSKLFQLMFEEPECVRSLPITVSVSVGDFTHFSFTSLVIWGGIAPGERFNTLGVYEVDKEKRQYERTLVWFRKFPFFVSAFRHKEDINFQGRYDNLPYEIKSLQTRGAWNISEIDDFTVPDIKEGSISSPTRIVYFTSVRKFLARGSDGFYYGDWTGGHSYGSGPKDLMDTATGLPRTDIDFIVTDSEGLSWIYQFNGYNLVKSGLLQNTGFIMFHPESLFPDAKRVAVIRYNSAAVKKNLSVFDDTFDYTFAQCDETVSLIKLLISNDTEGHYLRWIDNQGNIQFFLFKDGKVSTKSTLGGDSIEIQEPLRDLYFANMGRTQNISHTVTCKCCAVHLPESIYNWVKTILTSPIIDKYMGRDNEDNEIWVPVNIVAGSADYNPNQNLNDLEISFTFPSYNSQSL